MYFINYRDLDVKYCSILEFRIAKLRLKMNFRGKWILRQSKIFKD